MASVMEGTLMGFWKKLKRGPLFYWGLGRCKGITIGKRYCWQTPWFTLWGLWNTWWSVAENGRRLFKGIVLEYDEHDEEGYIGDRIEWMLALHKTRSPCEPCECQDGVI